MSQYVAEKVVEIARAMGGKIVVRGGTKRTYMRHRGTVRLDEPRRVLRQSPSRSREPATGLGPSDYGAPRPPQYRIALPVIRRLPICRRISELISHLQKLRPLTHEG
jgi:hypothetical protein